MRLIDADELMEHVGRDRLDSRELIMQMVLNAPTASDPTLKDIYAKLTEMNVNLSFRIQTRPTRAFPLDGPPVYGCPVCETVIEKGVKYCSECGQAILWMPND